MSPEKKPRVMRVPTGCVTVAQAAEALGMHRDTFDKQVDDLKRWGLVEANRVGRRRFFAAESIKQVLWRRRTGGLRRIS